ncbi:MAG: hypothetical protein H0V44_14140, partial [Planctomycetes bacterium]|nr:hypothetical protein [Planctomycetota bacterium]
GERTRARERCADAARACSERIDALIDALADPAADEPAAGTGHAEALRLRGCLAHLGGCQEFLDQLRESFAGLRLLADHMEGRTDDVDFIAGLRKSMSQVRAALIGLQRALVAVPYPFDPPGGSIARYAIDQVPPADDLGGIGGGASRAIEALYALHARVLGRLAVMGEALEGNASLTTEVAAPSGG